MVHDDELQEGFIFNKWSSSAYIHNYPLPSVSMQKVIITTFCHPLRSATFAPYRHGAEGCGRMGTGT
ncbi:hypothetical protein NQ318_001538, partial [Aromia moschata]